MKVMIMKFNIIITFLINFMLADSWIQNYKHDEYLYSYVDSLVLRITHTVFQLYALKG